MATLHSLHDYATNSRCWIEGIAQPPNQTCHLTNGKSYLSPSKSRIWEAFSTSCKWERSRKM